MPEPITPSLLRRLARCARAEIPSPHQLLDEDARRESAFDAAAVAWLEQHAAAPDELRAAIQRDEIADDLDGKVVIHATPGTLVRRLLTMARRAGFEHTEPIRDHLFAPAHPQPRKEIRRANDFTSWPRERKQIRAWLRATDAGLYSGPLADDALDIV